MLYEKAQKESDRLTKEIQKIKSDLKHLPEGKLHIVHDGNNTRWYNYLGDNKKEYLNKSKIDTAKMLAKKFYLSLLLKDLEHEKRAIEFYLRHHIEHPWKSEKLIMNNDDYQKLLHPDFQPKSQELIEWENEPYQQNLEYREHLIFKIPNGKYVRSKSEALIAMILCKYNIPFRYECALDLGGTVIFPDFTIRHPKTGEYYYFEHFGLFDRAGYRQKNCNRIFLYGSHGIYPTINLLMTFETDDDPLDIDKVEKMIQEYFVD